MSHLDLPGKLYKHRYNCILFGTGLLSLFTSRRGGKREKGAPEVRDDWGREGSKVAGSSCAHIDLSPRLWSARQPSFSQPPNVLKFINFLAQNNKNKKYENPLAPTDLITKETSRQWTCRWLTQGSRSGFLSGVNPPIHSIVLPNQSIRRNPEPHSLQNK